MGTGIRTLEYVDDQGNDGLYDSGQHHHPDRVHFKLLKQDNADSEDHNKKPVCVREGDRCLQCSTVCENCVDSCPNRANVVIAMADGSHQIVHVDKMCNECGNCTQFCPYASEPCHDKFTLFQTAEDMADSHNAGVLFLGGDMVRVRTFGEPKDYDLSKESGLPADLETLIVTIRDKYGYLFA